MTDLYLHKCRRLVTIDLQKEEQISSVEGLFTYFGDSVRTVLGRESLKETNDRTIPFSLNLRKSSALAVFLTSLWLVDVVEFNLHKSSALAVFLTSLNLVDVVENTQESLISTVKLQREDVLSLAINANPEAVALFGIDILRNDYYRDKRDNFFELVFHHPETRLTKPVDDIFHHFTNPEPNPWIIFHPQQFNHLLKSLYWAGCFCLACFGLPEFAPTLITLALISLAWGMLSEVCRLLEYTLFHRDDRNMEMLVKLNNLLVELDSECAAGLDQLSVDQNSVGVR